MKLSNRLENALLKLYSAYTNNTLNAACCNQCAVGTICDSKDFWKNFSDSHGTTQLNYVGLVNQRLGRKFMGYTPIELLTIEASFLKGCGYILPLHHKNKKPKNPLNKQTLFNGFSACVEMLCKLDNVPNVMEFSFLEISNMRVSFSTISDELEEAYL